MEKKRRGSCLPPPPPLRNFSGSRQKQPSSPTLNRLLIESRGATSLHGERRRPSLLAKRSGRAPNIQQFGWFLGPNKEGGQVGIGRPQVGGRRRQSPPPWIRFALEQG